MDQQHAGEPIEPTPADVPPPPTPGVPEPPVDIPAPPADDDNGLPVLGYVPFGPSVTSDHESPGHADNWHTDDDAELVDG